MESFYHQNYQFNPLKFNLHNCWYIPCFDLEKVLKLKTSSLLYINMLLIKHFGSDWRKIYFTPKLLKLNSCSNCLAQLRDWFNLLNVSNHHWCTRNQKYCLKSMLPIFLFGPWYIWHLLSIFNWLSFHFPMCNYFITLSFQSSEEPFYCTPIRILRPPGNIIGFVNSNTVILKHSWHSECCTSMHPFPPFVDHMFSLVDSYFV